jgi:hypothetical protein
MTTIMLVLAFPVTWILSPGLLGFWRGCGTACLGARASPPAWSGGRGRPRSQVRLPSRGYAGPQYYSHSGAARVGSGTAWVRRDLPGTVCHRGALFMKFESECRPPVSHLDVPEGRWR